MELFGKTTGDDSDDPEMPASAIQHKGRVVLDIELFLGLLVGRDHHAALERLSIHVESFDVFCQRFGSLRILGRKQFDA